MIKNLIEKLKKQNWTFTFIGTDDLDVENIALDMGIDNHLQFSEDEAGTKKMFARENRARERYVKCCAMDCKMEVGSYFEEKSIQKGNMVLAILPFLFFVNTKLF